MMYNENEDMSSHIGALNSIMTEMKCACGLDLEKLHVVAQLQMMPQYGVWATVVTLLKSQNIAYLALDNVITLLTETCSRYFSRKAELRCCTGRRKTVNVILQQT